MTGSRLVAAALFLFAGLLPAQVAHPSTAHGNDIYAEYSNVPNNFHTGYGSASGWTGGLDLGANRVIGAAIEVSQFYSGYQFGESAKTLTILAGPRIWIPVGRSFKFRPFGDVLLGCAFGINHNFASTENFTNAATVALAADAGLDYRLTSRLAIRAEGGFLHDRFTTSDNQVQQFFPGSHARLSTGLLYRF